MLKMGRKRITVREKWMKSGGYSGKEEFSKTKRSGESESEREKEKR